MYLERKICNATPKIILGNGYLSDSNDEVQVRELDITFQTLLRLRFKTLLDNRRDFTENLVGILLNNVSKIPSLYC